jgi:MFS family permease
MERGATGAARPSVFRAPAFRRLFLAHTVSRWGDTFNGVALVIVAFRLTGSGLGVAGTVVFEVAPVLLLGFVAGAVVDRYPRRRVMIAADLGRAAVCLGLLVAGDQMAVVYASAFGLSAGTTFFNPAAASLLPAVVAAEDVVRANAALWSAAVISQIALAPAAGILVAIAGAGPAFGVNAASFLVSAVLLRGVTAGPTEVPGPARRLRGRDLTEGLRVLRASRLLGTLAGVQALAALSAGATSALLVVLADRHLHVGPGRFGLLLAAIGAGAGLGPLLLRRVMAGARRPTVLFGPYLLRGGVDLTLAASSSFPVALAALAAYGVGTSTGMVAYNSVLQTSVPDGVRGRVFAFFDVQWQVARLAGIAGGGILAEAIGIRAVYVLGGLVLLGAGAFGLARSAPLLDVAGDEALLDQGHLAVPGQEDGVHGSGDGDDGDGHQHRLAGGDAEPLRERRRRRLLR